MAKPKKLPSGKWMVQVYRNGARKAFVDADKFVAQQMAAQWLASSPKPNVSDPTFRQAATAYNMSRRNVLSPTTCAEYRRMAAESFFPFSETRCSAVTSDDVQKYINTLALTKSPKTCRNYHGYINAVLTSVRPDLRLDTDLPKKIRLKYKTPNDGQVAAFLRVLKGTRYELPVMLAAFASLRRSEICALDASDVDRENNIIHVRRAMVKVKGETPVLKAPKSAAGDRYIKVPKAIIDLMPEHGPVCGGISPATLGGLMGRCRKKYPELDLSFRFHDLRHYYASSQHALGVPDAYIMKSGGWESDTVLKETYRNTLDDVERRLSDKTVAHYEALLR